MKRSIYTVIAIAVILSLGFVYLETSKFQYISQMEETSANFSSEDLIQVRVFIAAAAQFYPFNLPVLSNLVKDNIQNQFGSWWSVTIFDSVDLNAKFYMTGTYDTNHQNKRYLLQKNNPYGFSIYIL
jgi:hypothetical protein